MATPTDSKILVLEVITRPWLGDLSAPLTYDDIDLSTWEQNKRFGDIPPVCNDFSIVPTMDMRLADVWPRIDGPDGSGTYGFLTGCGNVVLREI